MSAERDYVEEWLNGKPTNYANQYRKTFSEFLAFVNKEPKTILEERERDQKLSTKEIDYRRYERLAKKFYEEISKIRAPNTAMRKLSVVRSFFSFWGLKLQFRRGELKTPRVVELDYRPSLDDIKEICRVSTPRAKAIILTLESTGLRVSDLVGLKRQYIKDAIETQEPPISLEIPTKKEGVIAFPFLHSDAIDAIEAYLKTVNGDSKWLFANKRGKKMNASAINQTVQRMVEKAGIKRGGRRFRAHCLRKFLQTALEDTNINANKVKKIMGHQLNGSEEPYSSNNLREAYVEALSRLMISKAPVTYEELQRIVQGQALQINGLEQQIDGQERLFDKNWNELMKKYNQLWRFVVEESKKPPRLRLREDGILEEIAEPTENEEKRARE